MTRYYYRPWKDESLVSGLHFLRCRLIREGLPGVEHADALLRGLGVDPETLPTPQKVPKSYKRGELQRAILEALRNGPLTGLEITKRVSGDLPYKAAYKRTYIALNRMKKAGTVKHEGRLWLAP
ncbi:hypothetical protein EV656_101542 [Rhodovulum adriaticum]|uniref:Uncharacterized protein n=1 Tax=Rhodovulum adriaticum TaxID=35804 RepID=A0A4R2NZ91_RHOAD|nr:hypothetical protein EV656_101542 [Rhodovulum adriaticum]